MAKTLGVELRDMNRAKIPISRFFAFLCMALPLGCGDAEPKPLLHPNVLLVVVDSLRADQLTAPGGANETTPHLSRLASQGARFENAYAPSARALPSLVSMLTSLPPAQHGVESEAFGLAEEALTLAEVMRDRGFATAAFFEGGASAPGHGLEQGFEESAWQATPTAAGSDERLDEIARWFEAWKGAGMQRPFFVLAQLMRPESEPGGSAQGDSLEAERARYQASVKAVDARVGRLVAALDALGAENDTLVIVTSDRGHAFERAADFEAGEALREVGVRVPLIVRLASRLGAGTTHPDLTRSMDIGPTIMMLARVRRPEEYGFRHPAYAYEMRDLTEVLIGVPPDKPISITGDVAGKSRSLQVRGHKLIRYLASEGEDRFEFYDLRNDPAETTNLFDSDNRLASNFVRKLELWRDICRSRPRYAVPYLGAREASD